jgi:hypothetical protein
MEPLAKLFGSPARLKTLRFFIFNEDEAVSVSELAERANLSAAVARKEVKELVAAGLLRQKGTRSPARFQTDQGFQHFKALSAFIRETTSVQPKKVVDVLRKAGNLRLVALSGHFTGIVEPQVDLLVVGDSLRERALAQAVRSLEAELGREIRYASFATADFRYRMGVYDRLLRDIFDYPHRLLIDRIGL